MTSNAMNFKRLCGRLALLLCCLGLIANLRCEAQVNLVFNPSFEMVDSCPQLPILGYGLGERPIGWFKVNGTPDYFNACQPYGNPGGVPLNIGGWQEPMDGEAYSGMFTYIHNTSSWHEMVGSQLSEPLSVGSTYYVSFYINAAAGGSEWPMLASSHFGALFTMEADEWEYWLPSWPLRNFAQVYQPTVMADTAAWLRVSGSFVADSAYQYIVLGNHFDNAHATADTIIVQDTIPGLYRAYTYVDQICVSTDPLGCPLAQDVMEKATIEPVLFPNPATSVLNIITPSTSAELTVVDVTGRIVWHDQSISSRTELDLSGWSRGWYVAVVQDKGSLRSLQFVLTE